MQTYTPDQASPETSQSDASDAMRRLADSISILDRELANLPKADQTLLDTLAARDPDHVQRELSQLQQQIDEFWRAPQALQSRRTLFTTHLKTALHDEAVLKSYERDLGPDAKACLPLFDDVEGESPQNKADSFSLHVKLNEHSSVEIKGALVMSLESGRTLLALPGSGLTEFATHDALCKTVAQWLNDDKQRWTLLLNTDLQHQEDIAAITRDPALFLEAFSPKDVELQAIPAAPYRHALNRQIDKQREDVSHVCGDGQAAASESHEARINAAIDMAGLLGPLAMMNRRDQIVEEHRARTALPDWIKRASAKDMRDYITAVERYDMARQVLSSALNGAASADQYAKISVRTSLANDLGYDLDPDDIVVSTERTLPVTAEPYTVARTLSQLALYGLHPDDEQPGSVFMGKTTLSIGGKPVEAIHSLLTAAYIARLVNDLQLRVNFGEYQRKAYANPANQKLMRQLFSLQIAESAQAARMRGHISGDEQALINAITTSATEHKGLTLKTQHIQLNASAILGRIVVFRQEDNQGKTERLIMFTADAPRAQRLQGFNNETQLLHELVGWTASPEMSDYLVQQVQVSLQPTLLKTLKELALKPHPDPDFIQLLTQGSYDEGVSTLVSQLNEVAISNHEAHSPAWYLQATEAQRQKLVALEDAITGASENLKAKSHATVRCFDAYARTRASEKIAKLMGVATGTVDPDQIVITTPRESLTYTQMMRNGYDDGLGFLNPSADHVATFKGPDGVNVSALNAANVSASVRGKWLADDYIALIKREQLDPQSTGYDYRRKTNALITRLHMQAAALRSLLKGQIDADQYQWLKPSIHNIHRDDADSRTRYPVYPLQIYVDKPFIASHLSAIDQLVVANTALTHVETVQGCIALLPSTSRHSALLYTPNAADGIEFRLFSSFIESLSSAGMIDYYKDRCRIKARRILSFFLNDMKQGKANKAPFLPKDSIQDFAQICFNRRIERMLRDVEETTTGRNEMLSGLIWNSLEIIALALTLPFPPASFAIGAALSIRDNIKAVQALTGHSPEQAHALIIASVLNMAGAAGDFASGIKGFGAVAQKLAKASKQGVVTGALKHAPLPSPEQLYPIKLHNESFFITRPNANSHAPVYRSTNLSADEVRATGQYAAKDNTGAWQPVGQPSNPAIPPTAGEVHGDRIVNVSLTDLPRVTEGHAKGIHLGDGKHYIDMDGHVYQVHYDTQLKRWHIVDPANPFAFFGRQPVRLDEAGQWKPVDRAHLAGGGNDAPVGQFRPLTPESGGSEAARAVTSRASLQPYELPQSLQPHMDPILRITPIDDMGIGLDEIFEAHYTQMRQQYSTLRASLYRDAQAFFAHPIDLPPRPALPDIGHTTTMNSFLEDVLDKSNGLVLSETPKSIASKRFLIAHMQTLAEKRVEVIYLPHVFTDAHLRKLAKYRAKGRKIRSGSHEIRNHLDQLNKGALVNGSDKYDYYHLIKEAHRHGIEIHPLSASTSYPLDAHPVAAAIGDTHAAQKMSNFFSHKVLNTEVTAAPSKRWVALLDHKLASTHDQIPGIAQMEGVISVHIEDVPAGQATVISRDATLIQTDVQATPCDFKIEFAEKAGVEPELPSTPVLVASAQQPAAGGSISSDISAASEAGFRWDAASGWQRVASEEWLAESPVTALQQSLSDAAYDMSAGSREILHDLIYNQHKGLDSRYFITDENMMIVRDEFFRVRKKLRVDAQQVLSADLPPRPTMPAVDPAPTDSAFIERVYESSECLIVGEFHASIGSKKFLIDNMRALQQQHVKTLYMEHLLTDLHQIDLDRFFESGQMSKRLLDAVRKLDRGHLTDPSQVYNFEKLVIAAREHGLEIRAIDCAASYHLKGISHETDTVRQEMMNWFASRTIRRHQAVMGKHKWVALVGDSHSNTFKDTVPGLAELEGGIGLRVVDGAPATAQGITLDTGETVGTGIALGKAFVKGDFRLEIGVVRSTGALRAPQPIPVKQRLSRPGMFLIEQEPSNAHVVVHRSRDRAIHRTPVEVNADGKVFVNRPTWTAVHLQPYDDLDALIHALEEINLTRVA